MPGDNDAEVTALNKQLKGHRSYVIGTLIPGFAKNKQRLISAITEGGGVFCLTQGSKWTMLECDDSKVRDGQQDCKNGMDENKETCAPPTTTTTTTTTTTKLT